MRAPDNAWKNRHLWMAHPMDKGFLWPAQDFFGWRLAGKVTMESGDEVRVTVLDSPSEAFDVFAGTQEWQGTLKLGTLQGSGTLRMP
jgi:hypothetical protein